MKRIIACSDGTWNRPGVVDNGVVANTNVLKLFECICAEGAGGVPQLKVYDQGVGTGYSIWDQVVGGATGMGIDKNIKDIYTFLVLNYAPGDQVILLGFSRGAYTARSLAGFIYNCGILKPEYLHLIDKSYGLYRDRNDYSTPDSDLMTSFRRNYAHEIATPIHFIGVWDTVGSLGLPLPWFRQYNTKKYKFHDNKLNPAVRYAYHALAIDERRSLFTPTLWEQCNSVKDSSRQVMEQRWFVGAHSNVGGGYKDCGLSNIALLWLKEKAEDAGLCYLEPAPHIKEQPWDKGKIVNSNTPMYWLWWPKYREVMVSERHNLDLHSSVRSRLENDDTYRPTNLREFFPKE